MRVRSLKDNDELERARAARLGADALARHLARPRGRFAFARLAGDGEVSAGHALIAHERRALGVAVLECAVAELRVDRIGLGAAVQLLLGYRAAADLRATSELRCADVALGLVDSF